MATYTGNDIYCDLVIPRKIDIQVVAETDRVLAYCHTRPHWETHIVVTCKRHVPSLLELDTDLAQELLAVIKEVAQTVKDQTGKCRVLTNLGEYQDSKHLHFHISSGPEIKK